MGIISSSLNCLIRARVVTAVLKEGILTPIYKKGDPTNQGNYRGITVTPVLLKVLDHVLNRRHSKILEETLSILQKGFTEGCSSLSVAVILTECILESKNNKQDLLLTTLDTQKAFDVVDILTVPPELNGLDNCLTPLTSNRELDKVVCSQRHTTKRYNKPLLLHLEDQYTEVRIGSINIPHVTVVDDLARLTRRHRDMQVMVWDIENNTYRERYCVNPDKSSYLCFNIPKHETQGIELVM